ncbi:ParB/RepB/Spo0J family partition protein [Erwinia sp. 9145]|uniref:ParB/RepB/Spo0J family partition protein n=1 Tax=Erwinia sp. 9145 TaxID=1500895 RepID=UPI0005557AD7|nr:ParB/RepB/Spo0J family partition protein [Erwinia sp. 9145]
MAKSSKDAYGASGQTNLLMFVPESLHLITERTHPLYDERVHLPLEESMVLNIMEFGVLQPIMVWKDPETGLACVVAGRQRVRHALEANVRLMAEGKEPLQIPGVVKRGSAVRMAGYRDSENEIRQADTPLGRAKKMSGHLDRGHDENDLALMFGCTVKTVRDTLALLECTQAVQQAVESGEINATIARQLADLPPEEQRETVAQLRQAGEGAKGHEKSRRQRLVMGTDKPRLKTRKQITNALDSATGDYAAALRWVLGEAQEGS